MSLRHAATNDVFAEEGGWNFPLNSESGGNMCLTEKDFCVGAKPLMSSESRRSMFVSLETRSYKHRPAVLCLSS